jgi:hypothetical protein
MSNYTRATRYRLKTTPAEKRAEAFAGWAKKGIDPKAQAEFDAAWPADQDVSLERPKGVTVADGALCRERV